MSTHPRPIPEELTLDWSQVEDQLVAFIQSQMADNGFGHIVLGLSGGVDSAVVAALSVRAVGHTHVFPYLLPYRESSEASRTDAHEVARLLNLHAETVDLSAMADPYFNQVAPDPIRKGNVLARLRMIVLFDKAKEHAALVAGTGNKSEAYLGYTTLYGDSACSFLPLADLYKSQVWSLAAHLGLPASVISKAPSADLWPGQTDEGELGISYAEVDRILFQLLDQGKDEADLMAAGFDSRHVKLVVDTMRRTRFKRQLPPAARLAPRPQATDTQA